MRDGAEVSGKRKRNPKCSNLIVLFQKIKSVPPYRSLLTSQIVNSEEKNTKNKNKIVAYC